MNKKNFGDLLKLYRQKARDPDNDGKSLTQGRFADLIYINSNILYTAGAISEWERNKSHINKDDRDLLICIIKIIFDCGGLQTIEEANDWLESGNYRHLNSIEINKISDTWKHENNKSQKPEPKESWFDYGQTHSKKRRDQLILLDKVYRFWVNGILQKASEDSEIIELEMELYPEAIESPWQKIVHSPYSPNDLQSEEHSIYDLFKQLDRSMLILGDPGCGKTITLITLAEQLINLARENPEHPIPIILNLSSWGGSRKPISKWLVEELTSKYQIPRRTGAQWLEDGDFILLLDGLDEVDGKHQAACISALNKFREEFGLLGITLCSRKATYEAVGKKLLLEGAIIIKSLSTQKIDSHLASFKLKKTDLHLLGDIAPTPLTLSFLKNMKRKNFIDAQENPPQLNQGQAGSTPYEKTRFFEMYFNHMLSHRISSGLHAEKWTNYLNWLSKQMVNHSQTMILIEQIQPSWLPDGNWRRLYILVTRLITGLFATLLLWLIWLGSLPVTGIGDSGLGHIIATRFNIHLYLASLVSYLYLNFILSIVVAGIHIYFFEKRQKFDKGVHNSNWCLYLVMGVAVWCVSAILRYPFDSWSTIFLEGFGQIMVYSIVTHFGFGFLYTNDIQVVERIGWSWTNAFQYGVIGLLWGGLIGFVELQGQSASFGSWFILVGCFCSGLFLLGGLSPGELEVNNAPNQGMWLSAKNFFRAAILTGTMFLMVGIISGLWRNDFYGWLFVPILAGIAILVTCMLYGALNIINHITLRLLLYLRGDIPFDLAKFLIQASDQLILGRVGGGFIFIHRLLQDYLALDLNE